MDTASATGNTGTAGTTGGIKARFREFGSNKYVKGTKEFLQSNSLVAKFAFLVLVIIVFSILLSLGSAFIRWLLSPSPDPILVKGMIDAKRMKVITQNPNDLRSVPILRSGSRHPGSGPGSDPSVDDTGLEFTWSVLIFVDDFTY